MPPLLLDSEQRFTCQECARCCRRGWDIALTPEEVVAYRRAGAERWFRDVESGPEGTASDPFRPLPGQVGYATIRKRGDGACGFLSPQNRCRIHEELGGEKKPLSCRLFPFEIVPSGAVSVVRSSSSCPTVLRNEGELVAKREKDLKRLEREWSRAFPQEPTAPCLVPNRPLAGGSLATLRTCLGELLDRREPDGRRDLGSNVARMAHVLDDLSRHRVIRLKDQAFEEYLELTVRYAAKAAAPVRRRPATALSRLLFRGVLFIVEAARLQLQDQRRSGWRLALRARLLYLLAHVHGLAPAPRGVNLRAAVRRPVPLGTPGVEELCVRYLRGCVNTTSGAGRGAVEELGVSVALLNAGLSLAAARPASLGATPTARDVEEGLLTASDLAHAGGTVRTILGIFALGPEALWQFAERSSASP